ncbi:MULTISPECIES: hypothetical protein [Mesorhizobium]|uniref:hypothetical protein n=1 Tax=Mesorhizobium australicum TaxID=536018 RepID=UPI003335FEE7
MPRLAIVAATALTTALGATVGVAVSQDAKMSFFVTSVGSGKGADLGGLKGADAHCASLAEAAGVTGKTWHAYLSTSAEDARDRIGKGPWFNAKGTKIADDVASLHGDANGITKQTALNEKGETVNGRGDTPNRHDMLTGSKPDGTRIADQTCGDWTMSGSDGAAMMGHHDRTGLDDSAAAKSWNSSHASRGGCSQEALKGTGGDGLFYCFATN